MCYWVIGNACLGANTCRASHFHVLSVLSPPVSCYCAFYHIPHRHILAVSSNLPFLAQMWHSCSTGLYSDDHLCQKLWISVDKYFASFPSNSAFHRCEPEFRQYLWVQTVVQLFGVPCRRCAGVSGSLSPTYVSGRSLGMPSIIVSSVKSSSNVVRAFPSIFMMG
jgi:hypothetical protein